jgi:hypothetical protein
LLLADELKEVRAGAPAASTEEDQLIAEALEQLADRMESLAERLEGRPANP